jgi:C4-dicarboxylate-specific signal transduction histidine kinase
VDSGTSAAEIIDRLRSFFKKDVRPQRELVNLNQLITDMRVLLQGEAAQCRVSIRTDLPTDPDAVTADRMQLQQVRMTSS